MRATGWWLALAAVAVVSGCIGEGDECSKNSQCPRGFVCGATAKICVRDAAPVVQIDAPSATLTQATHTLTATVTDDVEVVRAELSADDGATWVAMTVAGDRASGEVALPSGLDSRPFPVKVRALDGLNQSTEASAALTVDRVGPQLTVTPPGALGGAEATFSGAVTDGSDTVTSVTATLGDGDVPATLADGGWTVRLPLPNGIGGERTLTVRAVDGLGNAAQATAAITLDTIAPIFTADAGQIVGQGPGLVRFRSNEPVQQVEATWRDAGVTVTVVSPTDFSVTVAAAAGTTSEPLIVRGRDTLGNAGQSTLTIEADTVAPTFMLEPNQIIGPTPAPVRFTASKPMGTVTARWRDAGVMVTTASATEFSVMVGAGPATTTERLEVSGADVRGNPGQRGLVVDTDTDAPQFVWLAPDAGARLGGDGVSSVLLSGTAQDLRGVAGVQFDLRDDAGFRPASLDDGGAWSLTVPLPPDDSVARLVVAQFTDGVGNVGTSTVPVVVDTVPPTFQFASPAVDSLHGGQQQQVTVTGTPADPGGIAFLRMSLADAGVAALVVDGGATATLPLPAGDYAPFEIVADLRDSAGNSSRSTRRVFVDRQAPVLVVTTPLQDQRLNIAFLAPTGGAVDVRVSATDADPQRPTVRAVVGSFDAGVVDGGFLVPTSPTDNGVGYSARLTATDRAGNSAVLVRQFSVDRVAPTVLALQPATGSRNLVNPSIDIRFSEPVWGPDAGVVVTGTTSTDSWNLNHDRFVADSLTAYSVVTATVANVVDAAGNSLSGSATTSFHVAARPPSPGNALATDVRYFDIVSDADGVATLAVVTTATAARLQVRPMDPAAGTFGQVRHEVVGFPHQSAGFEVQAHRMLTGLTPRSRQGVSYFDGGQPVIAAWEGTTPLVAPGEEVSDRLVLAPPQPFDVGLAPIGRTTGAVYRRGSGLLTGSRTPHLITLAADDSWYGWEFAVGKVYFFRTMPALPAGPIEFRVVGSVLATSVPPTEASRYAVTAAANADGSCVALSYTNGSGSKELAMIANTDDGRCSSGCDPAVTPSSTGLFPEVGTFGSAVLVARAVSAGEVGLFVSGADAASCTGLRELTKPGSRLPVSVLAPLDRTTHRAYRPVQLGTLPAIVYLDTQARLIVHYP